MSFTQNFLSSSQNAKIDGMYENSSSFCKNPLVFAKILWVFVKIPRVFAKKYQVFKLPWIFSKITWIFCKNSLSFWEKPLVFFENSISFHEKSLEFFLLASQGPGTTCFVKFRPACGLTVVFDCTRPPVNTLWVLLTCTITARACLNCFSACTSTRAARIWFRIQSTRQIDNFKKLFSSLIRSNNQGVLRGWIFTKRKHNKNICCDCTSDSDVHHTDIIALILRLWKSAFIAHLQALWADLASFKSSESKKNKDR